MKKEIRNGIIAGLSLLIFYFLVMTISSASLSATVSQFKQLWYWMIALSLGFGTQVGLFTHLKSLIKDNRTINSAGAVTATSTGTSGASMVACCAHHLSEVLPIIGLSGFSIFLTRYQIPIIVFGIVMNIFGIIYMLKTINKIKSHVNHQ
ncbi:MAG: hypothetical protein AAB441_01340 [Patescibacteria group bacterium]